MALLKSQAMLHCMRKAELYNIEMTLGKRIKSARERLNPKPTQAEVGAHFGVTDKAVSSWERDETIPDFDKLAKLAKILKIPSIWLLSGKGAPPPPDSLEVVIEHLHPAELAIVRGVIEALRKERHSVA